MRAIVFANGILDMPAQAVRGWVGTGDMIIAADGGARHALDIGLMPSHVIGDQDSLDPALQARLWEAGTVFLTFPSAKDETDLELALLWAASQAAVDEIVIFGGLGGRVDHAVANLLLLAMPELSCKVTHLLDAVWDIQVIRSGTVFRLSGTPGDTVSLIPLGGLAEGVRTTGLGYPLRGEMLRVGPARGVSNVLLDREATVEIEAGMVWCMHCRSGNGVDQGLDDAKSG